MFEQNFNKIEFYLDDNQLVHIHIHNIIKRKINRFFFLCAHDKQQNRDVINSKFENRNVKITSTPFHIYISENARMNHE